MDLFFLSDLNSNQRDHSKRIIIPNRTFLVGFCDISYLAFVRDSETAGEEGATQPVQVLTCS